MKHTLCIVPTVTAQVPGSYDDAIAEVRMRAKKNDWILVSDTAWDGYTDIPTNIMVGYGTIFSEIETQYLEDPGSFCSPISHVILQAGVGGFAAAGAAWIELNKLKNNSTIWDKNCQIIIAEPSDADCVLYNIKKDIHNINNLVMCNGATESIMSGLNCGMPSTIAYPILRDLASTYVGVGDEWARQAVREMYQEGIIAGESGAAGIAVLLAMNNKTNSLGQTPIKPGSTVLVINTEADTDPESFNSIINNI